MSESIENKRPRFSPTSRKSISRSSAGGRNAQLAVSFMVLFLACHPEPARAQVQRETIEIDAKAAARPFPHFWERMFGSGRAILTLRDSYRSDLREVQAGTGFEYIRFHAIFHDEVGLYDEDATGNPDLQFLLRRPDL